jgi:sporadic carbohydrate cluster protein (TIGR04323 family)
MKKKLRGYIFSREFMGERVPQNVQNLLIRDFCNKKNFDYLLSATEYAMQDCSMVLDQVIDDLKKVDGIVAYSIFQLPEKKEKRIKYLSKIIKLKKIFCGALENLEVRNKNDILSIEEIWDIKKNLEFSLQNF